ncbi:unnamed protein product, partial [Sphacelaria rigidula]
STSLSIRKQNKRMAYQINDLLNHKYIHTCVFVTVSCAFRNCGLSSQGLCYMHFVYSLEPLFQNSRKLPNLCLSDKINGVLIHISLPLALGSTHTRNRAEYATYRT